MGQMPSRKAIPLRLVVKRACMCQNQLCNSAVWREGFRHTKLISPAWICLEHKQMDKISHRFCIIKKHRWSKEEVVVYKGDDVGLDHNLVWRLQTEESEISLETWKNSWVQRKVFRQQSITEYVLSGITECIPNVDKTGRRWAHGIQKDKST